MSNTFKQEMKNVNWRLFADDWKKLVPGIDELTARELALKAKGRF